MTRAPGPNPLRVGFMPRGRRLILYAVALSVLALIVTWGLLVAISVIGSERKQGVAAPIEFDNTDQLMSNATALQPADSAA